MSFTSLFIGRDDELGLLRGLRSKHSASLVTLTGRRRIGKSIDVDPAEIVYDNPYFQRSTTRQPGCQIDYLIQTKHGSLYACEMKFTRKEIGMDVVHEVADKLRRLRIPRNMSTRPILIHASSVSPAVVESEFFASIVNIADLLKY